MLQLFKKAKRKNKKKTDLFFQPSVFLLTSILECGASFPIKTRQLQSMGGKPHAQTKRRAARGAQDGAGRHKAAVVAAGTGAVCEVPRGAWSRRCHQPQRQPQRPDTCRDEGWWFGAQRLSGDKAGQKTVMTSAL